MAGVLEVGALVRLRDRHCVVTDVIPSTQPLDLYADTDVEPQHLVSLSSVEDDGLGEDLDGRLGDRARHARHRARRASGDRRRPARRSGRARRVPRRRSMGRRRRAPTSGAPGAVPQRHHDRGLPARAARARAADAADDLLIADDVGLGKTIEAGLVVQELLLRHRARTALVVCPASLQLQWRDELREKFGLEFRIVDPSCRRQLRRAAACRRTRSRTSRG